MLLHTAAPSADLAPWVHSYRRYHFTAQDGAGMTLYPGTGAEIWIVLSGALRAGDVLRQSGLLCLRHRCLDFVQHDLTVFAVRLKAGALPFFIAAAMDKMIDQFSSLPAVWGRAGVDLARQVRSGGDFDEQCAACDVFLQRQRNAGRKFEPMQQLATTIYETCADFSLAAFAGSHLRHRSGVSHDFHETQGVSVKYYHRLCRFERFMREALFDPAATLSDLSVKYGYYDQAHMNRDLRLLTQKTPGLLFGLKSARLFYAPRRPSGF